MGQLGFILSRLNSEFTGIGWSSAPVPGSVLLDLLKNHIGRESKMDETASNPVVILGLT